MQEEIFNPQSQQQTYASDRLATVNGNSTYIFE